MSVMLEPQNSMVASVAIVLVLGGFFNGVEPRLRTQTPFMKNVFGGPDLFSYHRALCPYSAAANLKSSSWTHLSGLKGIGLCGHYSRAGRLILWHGPTPTMKDVFGHAFCLSDLSCLCHAVASRVISLTVMITIVCDVLLLQIGTQIPAHYSRTKLLGCAIDVPYQLWGGTRNTADMLRPITAFSCRDGIQQVEHRGDSDAGIQAVRTLHAAPHPQDDPGGEKLQAQQTLQKADCALLLLGLLAPSDRLSEKYLFTAVWGLTRPACISLGRVRGDTVQQFWTGRSLNLAARCDV